jgi:signal transduction histidine kinase
VETLLGSLARLLGADWIALTWEGGRMEVREKGNVVRRGGSSFPRDVDPGLVRTLEPGRAASLGPDVLRRWPRTAGSGLRELLAYATRKRPSLRLLAGLRAEGPLGVRRFEELARFTLEVVEAHERAIPATDRALETACATHDLRHLLTVALLEIERARAEGSPGRTEEALACVQRTLETARSMCETAGGEREILPLLPILESAARDAETGSGRRGRIAVRVHCAGDLALRVDRGLLERVLRNLAANAIEATPDGGSVEIAAKAGPAGEILLSVRDEGRGIAREDLRDLLRAGRSGSGGSGYGTASVRACVRDLGGRLSVRSRPRAGTEFVIRLPLRPNERPWRRSLRL